MVLHENDPYPPVGHLPQIRQWILYMRIQTLTCRIWGRQEGAGVVARVESLRGRMSEGERQVEGLFESLLAESFGGAA